MKKGVNVSRRDFMKTTGTIAAAGVVSTSLFCAKPAVPVKNVIPVGLQLYSVRVAMGEDFAGTIAAVAKMGYQGVEFAGFFEKPAEEVRQLLDANGLKCCGSHTQMDQLTDEKWDATIEYNKVIGNKYIIIPWIDESIRQTKEDWLKIAENFNALCAKAKAVDMRVGYHNHDFEFVPVEGELPWDILYSNTTDLIMQVDTGNCMAAGGDPVALLKKYPGRATTIHLKEYSATNDKAILGEGDVQWKEVLSLCEAGGTEWYIIEEEKDVYPPVECVNMCLQNFKKLQA